MKFRILVLNVLLMLGVGMSATIRQLLPTDSIHIIKQEILDPDSLLDIHTQKTKNAKTPAQITADKKKLAEDFEKRVSELAVRYYKLPTDIEPAKIDSLVLLSNPFFIDLVFMGYPVDLSSDLKPNLQYLYLGKNPVKLTEATIIPIKSQTPEQIIADLRKEARSYISRTASNLYVLTYDELPDPNGTKSHIIEGKSIQDIRFVDDNQVLNAGTRKIYIKKEQLGPWQHKASGLAQFSQNYVSPNWYQGGNSNVAILGILTGQLNYDDKKAIQWDNNAEWRMGFNSVDGETIRPLSTNDDVLKINSKLGLKAGGDWFYSGSVDFSTQFFHSYKGINSMVMKTSFLSPVRLNISVGLDYKYKKTFSLMLSPVSYKYIYVNDIVNVNPNLFGVKTGEDHLREIGSSFKAIYSLPVTKEIQLDSKLSFYTNYQKVEIDWEVVCNMTINRFLSTRISINPRYDNTVIEVPGENAKLQFKQLLSVGFSHKFQ